MKKATSPYGAASLAQGNNGFNSQKLREGFFATVVHL